MRTSMLVVVLVAASLGACRSRAATTARYPCVPVPTPVLVEAAPLAEPQVFLDMALLTRGVGSRIAWEKSGVRHRVLTSEEADALRAHAARDEQTGELQAPKLLALSGHDATVFAAESDAGRPGVWAGFHAAVTPRVAESGEAVVLERLRVERRADFEAVPQVAEASGVRMKDGQTLAVGSSDPASGDFLVLITARVLPASAH